MAVPARRNIRMRVADYREWAATRPDDERWELIDGVPMMMSPAKGRHQRIVMNIAKRLDDLAERRAAAPIPVLRS